MAEEIEWDLDNNLPMYTKDWFKHLDQFVKGYRVRGVLFQPGDVEIVLAGPDEILRSLTDG